MPKSYSRKITEVLPQKSLGIKKILFGEILKAIFVSLLVTSFIILSLAVVFLYRKNEALVRERREIEKKYTYWVAMTEKYPNYAKTYYMAAVFAATLGRKNEAIKYLDKSLEVDSDFVEARELKAEIGRP